MFQFVTDTKIIPGYRKDHSGITLKLKLIDSERGRGYWKFNDTLALCRAHRGLPIGFFFAPVFRFVTVESLYLLHLLVIS